jgi:GNAT superfamily N-acetyltransferase
MKHHLDPAKNSFLRGAKVELFLAKDGKRVLGRIAVVINERFMEYHNEKVGFFALFEVIPKYQVAKELLKTGCGWLQSRGMETARGPVGFSNMEGFGLLVEGFDDPPVVMMPYNPEYYINFLERFGFEKQKDLLSYVFTEKDRSEKFLNIIKWMELIKKEKRINVRKLNMAEFESEVAIARELYNASWEESWTFVPTTESEFQQIARDLRNFFDPDLALIAEVDGKPAGYTIAIPDMNQVLINLKGRLFPFGILKLYRARKKIDGLRFISQVVKPEYRGMGTAVLLTCEMFREAEKKRYKKAEISWILEDNSVVRGILEKVGLQARKKYRIYDLALQ